MGIEIERKYLIKDEFKDTWKEYPGVEKKFMISQCYLTPLDVDVLPSTVRVRYTEDLGGEVPLSSGFITIKSNNPGASRLEYEYEIDPTEALRLNDLGVGSVGKFRYVLNLENGYKLEIDEFIWENKGLVVAELELQSEDDVVELPNFIGEEVTFDEKYFNLQLANNPFKNW